MTAFGADLLASLFRALARDGVATDHRCKVIADRRFVLVATIAEHQAAVLEISVS